MIDWLTIQIRLAHVQINDGLIVNYDRDGDPLYSVDKRLKVESSHSTSVQIRSSGSRNFEGLYTELTIDGNLNKYFNGHNIVGTDDVISLVERFIEKLISDGLLILPPALLKPSTQFKSVLNWQKSIREGDFVVKRIDINYMFRVHGGDVSEYIDFLSDTTRTRFSRTTQPGSGSVYWNQKSTHWSMKAYDKSKEMNARKKSHRLPEHWPVAVKQKLNDLVKPYVRFELVLRARKLRDIAEKLGYNDAYFSSFMYPLDSDGEYLKKVTPAELFQTYFEKIEVSEMSRFQVDESINILSHAAYGTFAAWRSGINVRLKLKKSTYYNHKKEIQSALGVDIALSNLDVERHTGTTAKVFKLVMDNDSKLEKQVQKLLEAC